MTTRRSKLLILYCNNIDVVIIISNVMIFVLPHGVASGSIAFLYVPNTNDYGMLNRSKHALAFGHYLEFYVSISTSVCSVASFSFPDLQSTSLNPTPVNPSTML